MPRGLYKSRVGTVVSDKMDKTVVVNVIQIKEHPRYNRAIKRNTTYKVHDESESCQIGDTVLIIETKPMSKTKRWRVSKILERSKLAAAEAAEAESTLAEEEAEITGIGVEQEEPQVKAEETAQAEEAPAVESQAQDDAPAEEAPAAETEEASTETESEEPQAEEPEDKGGQG